MKTIDSFDLQQEKLSQDTIVKELKKKGNKKQFIYIWKMSIFI
jgi:hypothetical protein